MSKYAMAPETAGELQTPQLFFFDVSGVNARLTIAHCA
jgi:hypothetical protein